THWSGGAPTQLWLGTDGGIARSTNGTVWTNVEGAIATQLFRDIDIGRGSAANNAYTYGGTQDTGTVEHTPSPGTTWHLGIDGDGGRVAVAPRHPPHEVRTDNGQYITTSTAGAGWGGSGFVYTFAWDLLTPANVYATST